MAKSIFYIKTLTLLSLLMPSFFYGKQLGLNYVAQIQKMIIDKPSDSSYLRKERVENHDYFNNFKLEIGLFQEKPTYVFVSPSPPMNYQNYMLGLLKMGSQFITF